MKACRELDNLFKNILKGILKGISKSGFKGIWGIFGEKKVASKSYPQSIHMWIKLSTFYAQKVDN